MKNYYQILEVEPDASEQKIKEQYLFLVQAWHPDKFSQPDQKARAEEKIKEINVSYDILKSPAKRAEYDQKLQSSKKTKTQQPAPPRQAPPQPVPPRPAPVPPRRVASPTRKWGLLASWDARAKKVQGAYHRVQVFINGRPQVITVDELVGARVQYFLRGESKGIVDFRSVQHVKAAVSRVVLPNGYEIHILRLAPYEGRPEQIFIPKVSTPPRR
jgi:DnaJ-domain-containing protein 1